MGYTNSLSMGFLVLPPLSFLEPIKYIYPSFVLCPPRGRPASITHTCSVSYSPRAPAPTMPLASLPSSEAAVRPERSFDWRPLWPGPFFLLPHLAFGTRRGSVFLFCLYHPLFDYEYRSILSARQS
jgi:hypothetical protein